MYWHADAQSCSPDSLALAGVPAWSQRDSWRDCRIQDNWHAYEAVCWQIFDRGMTWSSSKMKSGRSIISPQLFLIQGLPPEDSIFCDVKLPEAWTRKGRCHDLTDVFDLQWPERNLVLRLSVHPLQLNLQQVHSQPQTQQQSQRKKHSLQFST